MAGYFPDLILSNPLGFVGNASGSFRQLFTGGKEKGRASPAFA
jgi:hypothetical protein